MPPSVVSGDEFGPTLGDVQGVREWCRRVVRRRDEQGAAALEFGLIMPVLLLLVFGIIQYGLYFWAMQGGNDVARDAARQAAVGSNPVCATFRSSLTSQLSGFSTGAPTITRVYDDSDPAAGVQVGEQVTVRVSFQSLNMHLPFIPMPNSGAVENTATARVENVTTQPEACA